MPVKKFYNIPLIPLTSAQKSKFLHNVTKSDYKWNNASNFADLAKY